MPWHRIWVAIGAGVQYNTAHEVTAGAIDLSSLYSAPIIVGRAAGCFKLALGQSWLKGHPPVIYYKYVMKT